MRKRVLLPLIFISTFTIAQNKFVNSVHLDFFGSQIDGDGYGGYHHIGLQGGFGSLYMIEKWEGGIGFEINYAQKGARLWPRPDQGISDDFIWNLNYIEVPIYYAFKKWGVPFEFGPTVSYLLGTKREFNGIADEPDFPYREIELGILFSFDYKLTEKLYFKFRVTNSISPILKVDVNTLSNWTAGAFHRAAGLNLTYYFNSPSLERNVVTE